MTNLDWYVQLEAANNCNLVANFVDYFTDCKDLTSCTVKLNYPDTRFIKPLCPQPQSNTPLFVTANCVGEEIHVSSWTVKRSTLTNVVVGCNIAICLLFVLNTIWASAFRTGPMICMYKFTLYEEKIVDKRAVHLLRRCACRHHVCCPWTVNA